MRLLAAPWFLGEEESVTELSLTAVVLAAGQGTRMKSALPKILHPLAGRPMVHHVVHAALEAGAAHVVVVVGHGRAQVEASLRAEFGARVSFAVQEEQRGTGHAVQVALPSLPEGTHGTLLLYGDTPLLQPSSLSALVEVWRAERSPALALLTCVVDAPRGYGRILRDPAGRVIGIREERDCSAEERSIQEINPGVYVVSLPLLKEGLARLKSDNNQGELYLTDLVAHAAEAGTVASLLADEASLRGINDRAQLHQAEQLMLSRIADGWRRAGVTIAAGVSIDATVTLHPDVTLEAGVTLRGTTEIHSAARVDVGCVVTDSVVLAEAHLKPYSVLTSARVGERAQVGPFAHLRPGSELHEDAHIGNFVETKATVVRRGAKANHLAYLGDGDIGPHANIGAGTIFCNYDGFQKHRTVLEEGAFVGSDSQLVAPVTIGAHAYIATGTTVTHDVPADALAISRPRQETKPGYASRLRARLKSQAGK